MMTNTTPWFDASIHSPSRPGWYDCKECQARHYWNEGAWYRNEKTLKSGDAMHLESMHWRGEAEPPRSKKSFTTKLEEDPVTKDLIFNFPKAFLKAEDWRAGDRIQMEAKNGGLIIFNLSKQSRSS